MCDDKCVFIRFGVSCVCVNILLFEISKGYGCGCTLVLPQPLSSYEDDITIDTSIAVSIAAIEKLKNTTNAQLHRNVFISFQFILDLD